MGAEAASLAEGVRSSLATLRDVAGITGSFVCTQSGRLIAREIPALFEDGVLAEAGSRLARITETFAASRDQAQQMEFAVVRYGENRLYLKAVDGGMLCIVVTGPVNMPALRMAANLVGRRIAAAVGRAQAELPPPSLETPARAAPSPTAHSQPVPIAASPAATATHTGGRRFRGRPVD